jgi:hypothetical protein
LSLPASKIAFPELSNTNLARKVGFGAIVEKPNSSQIKEYCHNQYKTPLAFRDFGVVVIDSERCKVFVLTTTISLASQTQLAMPCLDLDSLSSIELLDVLSIKRNGMVAVCRFTLASKTSRFLPFA